MKTQKTYVGRWVQLEIIVSNEISQAKKDKCYKVFSYVEPKFKNYTFYICVTLGHETKKGIMRGEEEILREVGNGKIENM